MNYILNIVENLAEDANANTNSQGSIWVYVALIGLVVLMLVLPMITQRKRNKEYTSMLDSLAVGDTVKTIGGIIGRVNKIQEKNGVKTIIVETGDKGSKTTMEFDIAAVGMILNNKKPVAPVVKEKVEEKVEEPKVEEEKAETPVVEEKVEEKIEEKKPVAKKTTTAKKSTTTKKATGTKKTTTTKKASK